MSLYSGLSPGGPSAHSDVLSASPDSASSRRALVEEVKRRGRACVSSRNYPDAEALYGKGAEVLASALGDDDGEDAKKDLAILRSNRSLCRLQMGKIAEALEDADAAVEYDPKYVKGHWRRGQAQTASRNPAGVLALFEEALKLEPTNKALKKEARAAKEKVEQERRLMEEAEKAGKENAGGNEGDVVMADASKPATKSSKPVTKPAAKKKGKGAKDAAVKDTDGSLFTASDHIDDNVKRLIGDIAPKKLGEGGGSEGPKKIGSAAEGTSAWNKAGTWEERDVTTWAKETLTAGLLTAEYILPDGSPSPGAHATVTKVSKLDGHASYATVRGKKRYIYEFSLTIEWSLTLGDDHSRVCHGELSFPDVDGTVELGDGYDVVGYRVDGGSAPGTGPLLDRFVRDGGLRESVHGAIDDWVRLFRATH
ncbi:hypothetical protein ACHAWF_002952 [Thalassiosira exigua]